MVEIKIKELLPGILLAVVIGIVAVEISYLHPLLDPLVVAIILGMTLNFILGTNEIIKPGAVLAPSIFIPIGIILYAKKLNFAEFGKVSPAVVIQIIVIIAAAFLVVYIVGKKLSVNKKLYLLIGTGTAICGASAIVIAAPVVKAKPEDTSVSIAVITVVSLLGVLILPILANVFSLNDKAYAVLAGSTLHMTGVVQTAVSGLDQSLQELATSIKLTRLALLIFFIPVLNYAIKKRFYVPWFIVVFVILGLLFTYYPLSKEYIYSKLIFSNYLFPIALGSIGLNTNLQSVINTGPKPLIAGLAGFIAIVVIFILGSFIIPY